MSQEYRDGLFLDPPPPDMVNPVGRWWCPRCNCLSAKCEARGSHAWQMKWMEDKDGDLEFLTVVFIIAATIFIVLSLAFAVASIIWWWWRYFHAVSIPQERWYCMYWLPQQIATVHSVVVQSYKWTGSVNVECQARLAQGGNTVTWSTELAGDSRSAPSFKQQPVGWPADAKEGDIVLAVVTATPRWWRGRRTSATQRIPIQLNDSRPRQ